MRIAELSVATITLLLAACGPHRQPTESNDSRLPFLPVATIQDLMDSEIDPAADYIWDSVGTVITAAGVEDRQPHTDEQWKEVRRRAITLIEATNLLIVPGRRVTSYEFPSAGPGVLSSSEIERKIAGDVESFNAFALALREVSLRELNAIERRDVAALSSAGEAMDDVCEACHRANWYPHEIIPELPDFKPAG